MNKLVNFLIGPALDWAVAKCEGMADDMLNDFEDGEWMYGHRRYSTSWDFGGPIIEREKIGICMRFEPEHHDDTRWMGVFYCDGGATKGYGPTPLIAAMRCYVASKLGNKVEIPEDLL